MERWQGPFASPNIAACVLLQLFMFFVWLREWTLGKLRPHQPYSQELNPYYKILSHSLIFCFFLLFSVISILVIYTGSRGAWIFVIIVAVCIINLRKLYSKIITTSIFQAVMILAGIFIITICSYQMLMERIGVIFSSSGMPFSAYARIQLWSSATVYFYDHPLIGIPDFGDYYYGWSTPDQKMVGLWGNPVNDILNLSVRFGCFGVAGFLFINFIFIFYCRSRGLLLNNVNNSYQNGICGRFNSWHAISMSLVAVLACGIFSCVITDKVVMIIHACILLIVTCNVKWKEIEWRRITQLSIAYSLVTVLLLFSIGFIISRNAPIQTAESSQHIWRALPRGNKTASKIAIIGGPGDAMRDIARYVGSGLVNRGYQVIMTEDTYADEITEHIDALIAFSPSKNTEGLLARNGVCRFVIDPYFSKIDRFDRDIILVGHPARIPKDHLSDNMIVTKRSRNWPRRFDEILPSVCNLFESRKK